MIATVRRRISIFAGFAAMAPKMVLAYSIWFWMEFVVQGISLVIFVAFWKAVYAEQATIGGLTLDDTLNYIILARLFTPLAMNTAMLYRFGQLMHDGQVGIELLRPLDFQAASYVQSASFLVMELFLQIPIAIVGWLLFHFHLPADPATWLAFLITALLGNLLLFFFDWMLGCVAFYSTETWGLGVLRFSIALLFSGSLVPIAMMPGWLQTIANIFPFSQALYLPVAVLSGIVPAGNLPQVWLVQAVAIVILFFLSRWVFRLAVRKVTVQGG